VVTLDSRLLGWRPRDLARSYLPFLRGEGIANYLSDPVFLLCPGQAPQEDMAAAIAHWAGMFSNPSATWDDLAFLRAHTRLPLVLKGILHPDDARARPTTASTPSSFPITVAARWMALSRRSMRFRASSPRPTKYRCCLTADPNRRRYCESTGIGRQGGPGGRPYVYGLALAGEAGVRAVLRALLAELDLTMALSGIARVTELSPELLVMQKDE